MKDGRNRTFGVALALALFVAPHAHAQMATIDMAHILETIHNGQMMYQSVQTAIQNLQYAYETTQASLKQLQQMDVSKINSFTDAVAFANEGVDFARRTENRFKAIHVTVGGKRIPISQFYRIPGEAEQAVIDDLTGPMSDWERARAWSYYGLDPANYMYLKAWKGRINEVEKQMTSIGDVLEEKNKEDYETIGELMQQAKESDSTVGLLQGLTALMQILIGDQKEANRIQAIMAQHEADTTTANDLPVQPRGKYGDEWIE